jgi:hypothetical protein
MHTETQGETNLQTNRRSSESTITKAEATTANYREAISSNDPFLRLRLVSRMLGEMPSGVVQNPNVI